MISPFRGRMVIRRKFFVDQTRVTYRHKISASKVWVCVAKIVLYTDGWKKSKLPVSRSLPLPLYMCKLICYTYDCDSLVKLSSMHAPNCLDEILPSKQLKKDCTMSGIDELDSTG